MPILKDTILEQQRVQILSLQEEITEQNLEIDTLREDKVSLRKQIIEFGSIPEA